MRIGLVDVDGKGNGFPNLALMKISAYHKAQGDKESCLLRYSAFDRPVPAAERALRLAGVDKEINL